MTCDWTQVSRTIGKHSAGLKVDIFIHIVSSHLSFESEKAIISLHRGQIRWQEQKLIDFIMLCTRKIKFLVTTLEGLFRTPSDRFSIHIHIVRASCSQLHAKSGIFCLIVVVVYWPFGLKFVYLTINLAFLGITSWRNFACAVLNDFVSK